jgi:hypothetical protein
MNNSKLSNYLSLGRRYSKSINLERDLDDLSALDGYILTDKAIDSLGRIARGLTAENQNNCWTLTGVYGTGKSAFTHFLISLLAPQQSDLRQEALEIIDNTFLRDNFENNQYKELIHQISQKNIFRAFVVGQREPITYTIIRGLINGANHFWQDKNSRKNQLFKQINQLEKDINLREKIDNAQVISLIKDIIKYTQLDIIFVFDELGKNFEYAVYNQGAEDLYLLQQLAELELIDNHRVYILGILHQAFSEYGQRLAKVQRNEWEKIRGRFEDIAFTQSAEQMMGLMGEAINHQNVDAIAVSINNHTEEWFTCLKQILSVEGVDESVLEKIYPLHPLTALILPTLCTRYAQNDRSLFTFLTSSEPFSLRNFLEETEITGDSLPTLKLDRVYDYFLEATGMNLASRPNLQRWVEVHDLIADAKRLDDDSIKVLKTIGILNLVTITGEAKATRDLVAYGLCDSPHEENFNYWQNKIDTLIKQGLITEIKALNELRIWQGSDFNVDLALESYLNQEQSSLVKLLTQLRPLKPIVAQRHSYQTGTLRYFERHYLDSSQDLNKIQCDSDTADGYLAYWLDDEIPSSFPAKTVSGLPVIIITVNNLSTILVWAREFAALNRLKKEAKELQSDGVARREVRYRLVEAEKYLNATLDNAFDLNGGNQCWIQGELVHINSASELNLQLSRLCKQVFHQSPILWNELINRRNLTSQGTKARRELISAMINCESQPTLGLTGYGPEVTMYYSLLQETKIHRPLKKVDLLADDENKWGFYPPKSEHKTNPSVGGLWKAIEDFCLSATDKPQTLDKLYQQLSAPPLGVKEGMIPVILCAVLLHHRDDVGIYQDGTFIPVLGDHHFELLMKNPERYGVKYFAIEGLRAEVFQELEAILRNPKVKAKENIRNVTLLTVVTPLYQFVKQLPRYTLQTQQLSNEARKVLRALQKTIEPDELLFQTLPDAFNLPAIGTGEGDDGITAKTLKTQLIKALREINRAYETLLTKCQSLLYSAFAVSSEEKKLREDLQIRASYLRDKCVEPILRRFTQAVCDESKSDRQWLESLVMIIADKPAESWTDQDVSIFEVNLADVARRFENLEVLQKEVKVENDGISARRITVTRPDGKEINRMVWIDTEKDSQAEELVKEILQKLPKDQKLRETILAKLTERIFQ